MLIELCCEQEARGTEELQRVQRNLCWRVGCLAALPKNRIFQGELVKIGHGEQERLCRILEARVKLCVTREF